MQTLLTAIQTYHDTAVAGSGSGLLQSTTTGGLCLEEVGEGVVMPYAVANVIAAPSTSKYGGVVFNEPQIQFTIFAATAIAALTAAQAFIAKFDEHIFTLSSGKNFFTQRLHDPLPLPGLPDKDEQGANVFGWYVTYSFASTT